MSRRHVLAGLGTAAGASAFPGFARAQASRDLVIPTLGGVWEQFWRSSVVPDFQTKSGANVTLDVGNGRSWGANLRAAPKDKPPYSVIMTNEVFASALRKEGYFEKLDLTKLPSYNELYDLAKKTNGWAALAAVSPIGIGYRTDLVKTPPKAWRDLWTNKEFAGKIGLYNYANSAGKMELLLASKIFGKDQYDVDAGFKALHDLKNPIQVDFNLSTLLSSGEIVVAPYDFGEISRLRNQGLPVDCIIPEEGMVMFDQTVNITANASNKDLAYKYADYLLSAQTQELMAKQFYVSPVNQKVVVDGSLKKNVPVSGADMNKILTWDWDFVNSHDQEFSERWKKEI